MYVASRCLAHFIDQTGVEVFRVSEVQRTMEHDKRTGMCVPVAGLVFLFSRYRTLRFSSTDIPYCV